MFGTFWQNELYTPLLNFLIILYNDYAFGNLGIAVIYLTILLRVFLIPFSIISERNSFKYEKITEEVRKANQYFKDDPVARKEMIRGLLREHRINPWASVMLLGIQLLVLILLYQVFTGGMNTTKLSHLYSSVVRPDIVNTRFLGIDIAKQNVWSSAFVAALIFTQVYRSQIKRRSSLEKGDIIFRWAFPLVTFFVLFGLPAVKAVFILTSMAFSYIVHLFRPVLTQHLGVAKKVAIKVQNKVMAK